MLCEIICKYAIKDYNNYITNNKTNMEFEIPKIIKLDRVRKEAIDEYIGLQEKFLKLAKKGILTQIIVRYLNDEVDLDKLTDGMKNKLDKASDSERAALIKKAPRIRRPYGYYFLKPFYIGNEQLKTDTCIDMIETDHLIAINKHLGSKVDNYIIFLNEIKDDNK